MQLHSAVLPRGGKERVISKSEFASFADRLRRAGFTPLTSTVVAKSYESPFFCVMIKSDSHPERSIISSEVLTAWSSPRPLERIIMEGFPYKAHRLDADRYSAFLACPENAQLLIAMAYGFGSVIASLSDDKTVRAIQRDMYDLTELDSRRSIALMSAHSDAGRSAVNQRYDELETQTRARVSSRVAEARAHPDLIRVMGFVADKDTAPQ